MGRPKRGTPRHQPSCHPERKHQAFDLCVTCYGRLYTAKRREKNPSYERYRGWAYHINRKYGMTVADFAARLNAQGGTCALCTMIPDGKFNSFCVDHDHTTGVIRGILCKFCNSKLGWFENRREKILAYLGSMH